MANEAPDVHNRADSIGKISDLDARAKDIAAGLPLIPAPEAPAEPSEPRDAFADLGYIARKPYEPKPRGADPATQPDAEEDRGDGSSVKTRQTKAAREAELAEARSWGERTRQAIAEGQARMEERLQDRRKKP